MKKEFDWASIETEMVKVSGLLSEGSRVAVHCKGDDTAGFALVFYVFLRPLHSPEQALQVMSVMHPDLGKFNQSKAERYIFLLPAGEVEAAPV